MKNVLAFFRDTLNGPLYYGVSLVCFILICICIYILRRIDLKEKKAEKEAISSRVVLLDPSGSNQAVEVSLNAVEDAGGQVLTNVTNVLAAQDIYSGSVSNDTNSVISVIFVQQFRIMRSENKRSAIFVQSAVHKEAH